MALEEDKDRPHLVFMYGTLKTTEANHKQLYSKSETGVRLVGNAQTVEKLPLIVATPFNLPFLLYKEGTGKHVRGELYRVDDETLDHLDWFEGHPKWYLRKRIMVTLLDNANSGGTTNVQECWAYGLPRFKACLLERPFLDVFHDALAEDHQRFRPYNPEKDGTLFHYLFDD